MRTIYAALLSAGAVLPLLAHATTAPADPTDAGASVPADIVQSAFDGYKSYQDGEAPAWQQLNRDVTPTRGTARMTHGRQTGGASEGNKDHQHGGDSK